MTSERGNTIAHWVQGWHKKPSLVWGLSLLWILGVGGLAFLWHLGQVGLIDETEPLFAEAARQMWVTGDWVTPMFNNAPRFDKPPLIYWLMALGYQTLGVNEWAVRLPSALSAIGLMGLVFYTLYHFSPSSGLHPTALPSPEPTDSQEATPPLEAPDPIARDRSLLPAWIGTALVALNPEMIAWGRIGVSDMLLTGCMDAALLAFFCGYAQPRRPRRQRAWYGVMYLFIALAILTKGPVGIVLPGLIIGGFLLYSGRLREIWREIFPLKGMVLVLGITLPWYILVTIANGEAYLRSFFGYHNFERFTQVVNRHSAPWYFYFLVVLVGFLPWSAYLPLALSHLRLWQRRPWCDRPRESQLGLFVAFWFLGIFGFFSIAVTKLPSYVLPLMPAAAILVALLWRDVLAQPALVRSKGFGVSVGFNLFLMVLLGSALLYSPHWLAGDPAMPDFPDALRSSGALGIGAGVWLGATLTGGIFLVRRQGQWLWSVNTIAFLAFLCFTLMPIYFLVDAHRQLPLRQLATKIVEIRLPQETVVMQGFEKPSLVFYTQQPITYIRNTQPTLDHLAELATTHPTPPTALLISYPRRLKKAQIIPDHAIESYQAGVYQLVRVPLQDFPDLAKRYAQSSN